jgi:hypothetical protein
VLAGGKPGICFPHFIIIIILKNQNKKETWNISIKN